MDNYTPDMTEMEFQYAADKISEILSYYGEHNANYIMGLVYLKHCRYCMRKLLDSNDRCYCWNDE